MVSDVYSSGHIIRFHGPLEKGAPYCDTQVDVNLHKATQGDWQFLEGNMSTGTKGRYPDDYFSIKKQGAEIVAIDAKGSPITEEKLDFYTNFVNEAARAYHDQLQLLEG